MAQLAKLNEMLNVALAQAAQECGTLLGQELVVQETSAVEVNREAYFKDMENASFFVGLESQGDYQGVFYVVLSIRDAIVLSGTLLGVPQDRITQKKKLAILEADDVDAFSEIANQITGAFNEVFKPKLPKPIHLKQRAPKQFVPGTDEIADDEPIADGDYFLLQSQLTLAGAKMEQIQLLIPLALAKLFDLQSPSAAQEEVPEEQVGETLPEEEHPVVLILDDNAADRQNFQKIFTDQGLSSACAPLDSDLNGLLTRSGLKAVLFGATNANETELSTCKNLKLLLDGISVPIIMCAREWTRTAVLKAIKYGAVDILLKPCEPEELATRLDRFVNSA